MNLEIEYLTNRASLAEITEHFLSCDYNFIPHLSERVTITDYAKKITQKATRIEAWAGGTLIGLVAVYCNDQEARIAYVTSVSILSAWMGKGIATRLMSRCIEHAKASNMQQISLEVSKKNDPAIKLDKTNGFAIDAKETPFVIMNLRL
jgi:ribosomal protein S18 acetylase RimI-like enzyme